MILVDVHLSKITEIYKTFAESIGARCWQKRVQQCKEEIRGNPFLKDFLEHQNLIAFQLSKIGEFIDRYGYVSEHLLEQAHLYQGCSFMAQANSFTDALPPVAASQFRSRLIGAFKNPADMRGLRLELAAATHFLRRKYTVSWPEISGEGNFDLLVENGSTPLEIECKSIGEDKGRRINQRETIEFFSSMKRVTPNLLSQLKKGLSAVLTVPDTLPTSPKDREHLAKVIAQSIFLSKGASLPEGTSIQFQDFDSGKLANIHQASQAELRRRIESITHTKNRPSMVYANAVGGVFALTVQSQKDDAMLDSTFKTLKDAASRQLSGTRAALLFVGFQDLTSEQMRSIANQDDDPKAPPTGLALSSGQFLSSERRNHVIVLSCIQN